MKETAATNEQPPELPPHWFLYLMERMDRMENSLRKEIGDVRSEFRQEIGGIRQEIGGIRQEIGGIRGDFRQETDGIRQEVRGIYRWSIGLLVTMLLGFGGIIATLAMILR
jgi:hypothetical protein